MFSDKTAPVLPLHVYAAMQRGQVTEQLFKGIQKYVTHPYRNKHTWPSKSIWQHNSISLYYYPGNTRKTISSNNSSLFLVPSLINGAEIFDLTEEYSFINFLNQHGIDVYLLNWSNIKLGDNFSFSYLIDEILVKSYIAAREYEQQDLHIMGHCLGGSVLLSGLANMSSANPPLSLTLLATPIDFHAAAAPWSKYRPHINSIKKIIHTNGKLSQTMMQSFFGQISPNAVIEKYVHFLEWGEECLKSRLFVKVEDWLNSGKDLPPALALDIFDKFFIENNTDFPPSCPTLIITSENDLVVPISAAAPENIIKGNKNVQIKYVSSGHLGMMASARAKGEIWTPFISYISSLENMATQ
jgi:polyhydroxyalkanoate synthase subunit PhaC